MRGKPTVHPNTITIARNPTERRDRFATAVFCNGSQDHNLMATVRSRLKSSRIFLLGDKHTFCPVLARRHRQHFLKPVRILGQDTWRIKKNVTFTFGNPALLLPPAD